MSVERALERIGEAVVRHQDATRPELDEERGLARFRAAVDRGVVRPPRRRGVMAATLAAAALMIAAVIFWPRASLTFAVEGGRDVAVAQWLDARDITTVRFSDGTRISALVGSRWRVNDTTPVGATLQLERGELTADVRSQGSSRWLVDAGPFSIHVTGTRFATSWDPVAQVFELQMHEGSVVLAGPVVGGQREVRAPEHLRIDVGTQRLAVVSDSPGEPEAPGDEPSASVAPEAPQSSTARAAATGSAEPRPDAEAVTPPGALGAAGVPEWMMLAQGGKHREALAAVRKLDAGALLASESPAGLLLLAQTARLAGDQGLATQALSTLASRFPDSVQAKTALFLGGKLHFDQGRYDQAALEMSRYLGSAPGGAFSGEAQVLLIVALHRAGRVAEAQALAGKYLESHPDGPHAARIRSIVSP